MRCLRLPFAFDPDKLRADLARVAEAEWIPHINRRHYDGQWSGAALRSRGGSAIDLVPEMQGAGEFRDTALLGRCDYFRDVLATFRCPLLSARLLKLHAGSNIAEHVDHALDFDDGEVRLHVPVVTSDRVQFFLDGALLVMVPGECWYTNVNLPHAVENRGTIDRIHLVLDCRVDDWLRSAFAASPRPAPNHYAARLTLDSPPPLDRLLQTAADYATASAPPAQFAAEGNILVFAWRGHPTWQLRLHLESPARGWSARLESSPDPEGRHRGSIEALLQKFTGEFPGLITIREGLA